MNAPCMMVRSGGWCDELVSTYRHNVRSAEIGRKVARLKMRRKVRKV